MICENTSLQINEKSGRGREIRTPDILLPKQARYQTALYPEKIGEYVTSLPDAIILTCQKPVKHLRSLS